MTDTPNRGIPYVPEATLDPAAGLNLSLNVLDAMVQLRVLSMALTAPPSTNGDGDLYIVAAPATGAWAGLEDHLVRYVGDGDFWQSYVPGVQINYVLNGEDNNLYAYDTNSPLGWQLAAGLGDAPNDGDTYARQSSAWVPIVPGIDVVDDNSPPTVEVEDLGLLIVGTGLVLTELSPGVALLEAPAGAFSAQPSTDVRVGDRLIFDGTFWVEDSPTLITTLFEDFLITPGASGGAGGWDINAAGAGAGVSGVVISGRPGVLACTTGTTNAGQAGVGRQIASDTAATTGFVIGGGEITFRAKIRFTALPTATRDAALRVGLMDEISGAPVNGIYLTTDFGTFADARIVGANRNGTLTYTSAASFIPTVNVWFEVEFVVNAAGTAIDFYAGGVHLGQSTTNLPAAAAMVPGFQVQRINATADATAVIVEIDYLQVIQKFSAAR